MIRVLKILLRVFMGLVLGLLPALIAHENIFHLAYLLLHSALGSYYDIGMTLFYATPLIFTGLAVCLPLQAGLVNIGVEGQLHMSAVMVAAMGILFPFLVFPWSVLSSFFIGGIVAALWAFIPGWLKVYRGTHEVISNMMLNFIAISFVNYLMLYQLNPKHSPAAETLPVGDSFLLEPFSLFDGAPVNSMLIVACVLAVLLWFFLNYTVLGYEVRMSGKNARAAALSGIPVVRIIFFTLCLGGFLSVGVGLNDILGQSKRLTMGFSPGYGFMGLAVALIANNHPIGIIFSALLMALLHKGSMDLEIETPYVTSDISLIMQACVILCVCAKTYPYQAYLKKMLSLPRCFRDKASL